MATYLALQGSHVAALVAVGMLHGDVPWDAGGAADAAVGAAAMDAVVGGDIGDVDRRMGARVRCGGPSGAAARELGGSRGVRADVRVALRDRLARSPSGPLRGGPMGPAKIRAGGTGPAATRLQPKLSTGRASPSPEPPETPLKPVKARRMNTLRLRFFAAMLPGLSMLGLFYSLVLDMRWRLGRFPESSATTASRLP